MKEGPEKHFESKDGEKQLLRERMNRLALELSESQKAFPFPGIHPDARDRLAAEDAAYPGLTTPIDEIVAKCKHEKIKIMVGADPGNVYAVPAATGTIDDDGLLLKNVLHMEVEDERLKELIVAVKDWFRLHGHTIDE